MANNVCFVATLIRSMSSVVMGDEDVDAIGGDNDTDTEEEEEDSGDFEYMSENYEYEDQIENNLGRRAMVASTSGGGGGPSSGHQPNVASAYTIITTEEIARHQVRRHLATLSIKGGQKEGRLQR